MGLWDMFRGGKRRDAQVHWQEAPAGEGGAAIYQICYSPQTRAALDPGFLVMDNLANARPDWREYHPIRTYLLSADLDEERFYGFFSPKFGEKTGLRSAQVHAFLADHRDADVALFCPFLFMLTVFQNSFLQGDCYHPGLRAAADAFLQAIGRAVDLDALVMDGRTSVFCNFFAAKPRFWRAWLDVNEQLWALAERPGPLQATLTAPARYRPGEQVQMKIFIQERVVDLLLSTQAGWKVAPYPAPELQPVAGFHDASSLYAYCNTLKAAYRDTGDARCLAQFREVVASHVVRPVWDDEPAGGASP